MTGYKIRMCGLDGDGLRDAEGAEAVELPNPDGLEFFVHHYQIGGTTPSFWAVSECSTGLRLAWGKTRRAAIDAARERLATLQPGELRCLVALFQVTRVEVGG